MPESSDKSLVNSILSLFKPFEIAGGIAAVVTAILWIAGLPVIALIAGGTVALTLMSVGIIGHVKMFREQAFQTLSSLSEGTQRRKWRPQSNLRFIGIEYQNLYIDDQDMYWEVRHNPELNAVPSYCALLRFSNDARPGRPGQPIKGLRARLIYRRPESGFEYAPIDRGTWVREEFNIIDLAVGDSRLLIIARGFPPNVPRIPNVNTPWFLFIPINNHHSRGNYGKLFFQRMSDQNLEVNVQLLAGDAGNVMYEGRFNLQGDPHLALSVPDE